MDRDSYNILQSFLRTPRHNVRIGSKRDNLIAQIPSPRTWCGQCSPLINRNKLNLDYNTHTIIANKFKYSLLDKIYSKCIECTDDYMYTIKNIKDKEQKKAYTKSLAKLVPVIEKIKKAMKIQERRYANGQLTKSFKEDYLRHKKNK